MTIKKLFTAGVALSALVAGVGYVAHAAPAPSKNAAAADNDDKLIVLSLGRNRAINLPSPVTDVVVTDPNIADVRVVSAKQIYILAKGPGETTISASDASGRSIYSAIVRVGSNLESLDQMMALAMPDAKVNIATMNGAVLLTGSVRQPEDIMEAERLVQAFVGSGTQVVSRLKTATPMQVNLQVRIAEVSRSISKDISSNFNSRDNDGPGGNGFLFAPSRGRKVADIASSTNPDGSTTTSFNFATPGSGNTLSMAKHLLGIDLAVGLDFAERTGLATTLAQPNLTTISGETARFQAGGQFPFPSSSGLGTTGFEFKNFGINLEYTPTVLSDGRILLRVRPEVSDISSQSALRVNGVEVPSIITRNAETTVELGSGQSFMIAGLLSNTTSASVDKFPGLGDVPILGTLFKSNGWKRNETELVIVVTPYLVKPVSESEIKLPTDGYKAPTDLERLLLNRMVSKEEGVDARPMPTVGPDAPKGPDFGSVNANPPKISKASAKPAAARAANAGPGFSFD
ncbi:type II and III secretion system protein family protein [Sphingorhabdus sp.]|jgi:pilus assembly protein CpaC|uniref:type II and III secretion system protein family protein n=2 Tax=Sphingorhabdus sp. TaxID=1902408 RepID=UPI003BAF649D|nr:type II and III secretion system protein family protein [Sphingomonadales bacterium]MBL0020856.1 type II and III secretion system protein family protein [Sphingomonadales bacterium]